MRNEKKHLFKVVLLFIACYMIHPDLFSQYVGDNYSGAKGKGEVNVIYVYVSTPGFIEKDQTGNMKGLLIDIINEFHNYVMYEKSIKINPKFTAVNDFKMFMDKVKSSKGGVFGLSNVTITPERQKEYNFSIPYISNISVIVTHKSVPTLTSFKDLKSTFLGKSAYVLPLSTHEKRILDIKEKYFPTLNIAYLPSEAKIMNKVITDQNTFANIDFIYFLKALQNKKPIKRHPVGDSGKEELGIIMPKSNDWSKMLNSFMKKYVSSINYRQMVSKNLGANALNLLDGLSKSKTK